MRNFFFFLILIFFSFQSKSQSNSIDSLKWLLKNAKHDTTKLKLRYQIGEESMLFRTSYWDSLIIDSRKLKNIEIEAASVNNLAFIYDLQGKYKESIKLYLKSVEIEKITKNEKGLAISYTNLGYTYNKIGDIRNAFIYFNKSLKIFEKLELVELKVVTYNNIADIYEHQNEHVEARKYFLLGLKEMKKSGNKKGISDNLHFLAYSYDNESDRLSEKEVEKILKLRKKALKYYKQSLKIREKINFELGIAFTKNNIGLIYYNNSKLIQKKDSILKLENEALKLFNESAVLFQKNGDVEAYNRTLISIARYYLEKNNISKAKEIANSVIKTANEIAAPTLINDAALISKDIAVKLSDWKKAFEMLNLHIEMKEKLSNEETQKTTFKQQSEIEYQQKKAKDALIQAKKDAVTKAEKQRQRFIIFTSIGALFLISIFFMLLYNRFKTIKKQKIVIEKQKHEVEIAHQHLEEKNREILDSITYAKRIQSAILPQPKLVKEFLEDSFILYKPKDIVAGDFYWLEVVGDTVLFAAADCTGHGVPGAMVSVVCNNGLNRAVREFGLTKPNEILDKTRELVIQEFEKSDEDVKDGMDISLCALDTKTNVLKWSGANNPLWILRKNTEGQVEVLETKPDKQPIGKHFDAKPFTQIEIQLQNNDSIYIFTDGFQDQFGGAKEKKFRAAKMKELFLSLYDKIMEEQRKIIDESFESWKGELEQVDDVCVIGVRI
jgi:serine phosphatase RsbU (regulator of sigma subunit)/tetratricopeptide (TPR) repeat protein